MDNTLFLIRDIVLYCLAGCMAFEASIYERKIETKLFLTPHSFPYLKRK